MTEADALGNDLQHLVALLQGHDEGVQVGRLGCPCFDLSQRFKTESEWAIVEHGGAGLLHLLALRVDQLQFNRLTFGLGNVYFTRQDTFLIVIFQIGIDEEILNVYLRCSIEIHLAGNACEAPEVLIFEIGTVAPAHDLHGDEILAFLQVFRDIELSSHLRVLGVAHVFAVHPERKVARGGTDVEDDFLSVPILRQFEGTAVGTGVVVRLADIRGIALEGGAPSIAHVLVDGIAIAVELEKSRHGEVRPLRIVVLQGEEALGGILMVFHKVELPLALHREETGRLRLVSLTGEVFVLICEEMGMTRLTIHLVHFRVEPHGRLLGMNRYHGHGGQR